MSDCKIAASFLSCTVESVCFPLQTPVDQAGLTSVSNTDFFLVKTELLVLMSVMHVCEVVIENHIHLSELSTQLSHICI